MNVEIIEKNIWYPQEIFNIFLRNDTKYFLETERKKCNLFLEIASKISEKDTRENFINISKKDLNNKNNIFSWLNNKRFLYKTNFDYLHEYSNLLDMINYKKSENLNQNKRTRNINKNDKLSNKQKQQILLILKNNFETIDAKIENNYNFDLNNISL